MNVHAYEGIKIQNIHNRSLGGQCEREALAIIKKHKGIAKILARASHAI
jgi:hypothetical protein